MTSLNLWKHCKNLGERELLINLDFNGNYSNQNQNEIQSVCFGINSLSLFTACAFYNNDNKTQKGSPSQLPAKVVINQEWRLCHE